MSSVKEYELPCAETGADAVLEGDVLYSKNIPITFDFFLELHSLSIIDSEATGVELMDACILWRASHAIGHGRAANGRLLASSLCR